LNLQTSTFRKIAKTEKRYVVPALEIIEDDLEIIEDDQKCQKKQAYIFSAKYVVWHQSQEPLPRARQKSQCQLPKMFFPKLNF
jgi:hypothetical protein